MTFSCFQNSHITLRTIICFINPLFILKNTYSINIIRKKGIIMKNTMRKLRAGVDGGESLVISNKSRESALNLSRSSISNKEGMFRFILGENGEGKSTFGNQILMIGNELRVPSVRTVLDGKSARPSGILRACFFNRKVTDHLIDAFLIRDYTIDDIYENSNQFNSRFRVIFILLGLLSLNRKHCDVNNVLEKDLLNAFEVWGSCGAITPLREAIKKYNAEHTYKIPQPEQKVTFSEILPLTETLFEIYIFLDISFVFVIDEIEQGLDSLSRADLDVLLGYFRDLYDLVIKNNVGLVYLLTSSEGMQKIEHYPALKSRIGRVLKVSSPTSCVWKMSDFISVDRVSLRAFLQELYIGSAQNGDLTSAKVIENTRFSSSESFFYESQYSDRVIDYIIKVYENNPDFPIREPIKLAINYFDYLYQGVDIFKQESMSLYVEEENEISSYNEESNDDDDLPFLPSLLSLDSEFDEPRKEAQKKSGDIMDSENASNERNNQKKCTLTISNFMEGMKKQSIDEFVFPELFSVVNSLSDLKKAIYKERHNPISALVLIAKEFEFRYPASGSKKKPRPFSYEDSPNPVLKKVKYSSWLIKDYLYNKDNGTLKVSSYKNMNSFPNDSTNYNYSDVSRCMAELIKSTVSGLFFKSGSTRDAETRIDVVKKVGFRDSIRVVRFYALACFIAHDLIPTEDELDKLVCEVVRMKNDRLKIQRSRYGLRMKSKYVPRSFLLGSHCYVDEMRDENKEKGVKIQKWSSVSSQIANLIR